MIFVQPGRTRMWANLRQCVPCACALSLLFTARGSAIYSYISSLGATFLREREEKRARKSMSTPSIVITQSASVATCNSGTFGFQHASQMDLSWQWSIHVLTLTCISLLYFVLIHKNDIIISWYYDMILWYYEHGSKSCQGASKHRILNVVSASEVTKNWRLRESYPRGHLCRRRAGVPILSLAQWAD